jgi:hypothetical protein
MVLVLDLPLLVTIDGELLRREDIEKLGMHVVGRRAPNVDEDAVRRELESITPRPLNRAERRAGKR